MLQNGFTLLETLVALLILSIGLLGLAGLQLSSVKNSRDVYYRTQATILAQDIAERMRANRQGVEAGNYQNASGSQNASCRNTTGCSSAQLAADDVFLWRTAVAARLPSGEAWICLDGTPDDGTDASNPACDNNGVVYTAKLWWDDDRDPTTNHQRLSIPFTP